jgi:hypothetical protein
MSRQLAVRRPSRTIGVLAAGGVIGALVGVGAAYLLVQAREARARRTDAAVPLLTADHAIKLGVLLFGLFRQINDIARGE